MREKNSQLKNELAAKNEIINNLQAQLNEKENAIATLQTELNNRLAEAAKTETFLSEELQRFKYGIVPSEEPCGEQLQLFPPEEQAAVISEPETIPTPEPESENTESPAVNPQPSTVNPQPEETEPDPIPPGYRVVENSELVQLILKEFPKSRMSTGKINDAIRDRHKNAKGKEISRLACYERDYNFKFIGKIEDKNQFQIPV